MNAKKLTVIVPVFNAENVLPGAFACLYGQSFLSAFPGGMEILMINDASTDHSLGLLRSEEEKHPELIRVIDLPENRGPGGARNAGMDQAAGEYIGFFDCDDTVDPAMYETLYRAAFSGDGYDLADCGVQNDNMAGQIYHYTPTGLSGTLDDAKKSRLLTDVGYLWSRLYRRSLLNDPPIRFREGVVSEDLDFLSEVIARASSVTAVPEVLYRYHDTPDSASKRDAEVKFFETTILAMRGVYDRLTRLPSYAALQAGAEYTISRLAVETLYTIAGFEQYQAVTPEFAGQLRGILAGELRRMVRIPVEENSFCTEKLAPEMREALRSLMA